MKESESDWVLRIVDRECTDDNREIRLPKEGRVVIGRSLDKDVVLRHLPDGETIITFVCDHPTIKVEVQGGTVSSNSQSYSIGDVFDLGKGGLTAGSLRLSVDGIVTNSSDHRSASDMGPIDSVNDSRALIPFSQTSRSQPELPWWQRRSVIGASLALGLSVAMIGLQVKAFSRVKTVDPRVAFEDYLLHHELSGVSLNTDNRPWVLIGRVGDRSELLGLEQFVSSQAIDVGIEVVDGQSIRSQVEDLFRINGVIASAQFDDDGMLWVQTAISDTEQLEALRNAVSNDMPRLTNWDISNTPPESPFENLDPGKRVAMVVSDDPAFVLTADQTRYFIGSLLPTGHKITEIDSGRVIIEKNGEKSELDF